MNMPKKFSAWFMILYFLVAGLATFFPTQAATMPWGLGILALGAAVFLFLDK